MRHVFPVWVVLDGVVELRGPRGKGVNTVTVQAPAPLRVRVAVKDALLNLALQAFPFFLGRLWFHPRRTL